MAGCKKKHTLIELAALKEKKRLKKYTNYTLTKLKKNKNKKIKAKLSN